MTANGRILRKWLCARAKWAPSTWHSLHPMIPDALTLARAIHVLAIVHWIGGVCAVTPIVLPQARRLADASAAVAFFESFERRFVRQVRISIALAGVSGRYMLHALDPWDL